MVDGLTGTPRYLLKRRLSTDDAPPAIPLISTASLDAKTTTTRELADTPRDGSVVSLRCVATSGYKSKGAPRYADADSRASNAFPTIFASCSRGSVPISSLRC